MKSGTIHRQRSCNSNSDDSAKSGLLARIGGAGANPVGYHTGSGSGGGDRVIVRYQARYPSS